MQSATLNPDFNHLSLLYHKSKGSKITVWSTNGYNLYENEYPSCRTKNPTDPNVHGWGYEKKSHSKTVQKFKFLFFPKIPTFRVVIL